MIATGKTLLINGGGQTMGWVGSGMGVPGWIPIFGGHTIHDPTGQIKIINFLPGGMVKDVIVPEPDRLAPHANQQINVGNWMPMLLPMRVKRG
jgi:hypothetical protein